MARAGGGSIVAMILLAISGSPVVTEADAGGASPNLVPATHLRGAVCVVSGNSSVPSPPSTTSPTVSAHPTGVDIVWLPGLNSKTCKAVLSRGNAHIASALANDINHAPVVPAGPASSCPNDDGTSARMYFTYAHRPSQRIDADLSGCSWINAPGDASRSSTAKFRYDMVTLAPKAWRAYIAPNPN